MNILLTSVGRRGYLVQYFKQALNGMGKIHVANSSPITPAFSYADRWVVTPLIYDKDYIHFLIQYCETNNIDAIISLFDIDLPILASHKDLFQDHGISLLVSDIDVINICNDKWLTYSFLQKNNIQCPKTYLSLETVQHALQDGSLRFPLIVKPRWGMGSIAVLIADNMEELNVFYKKAKKDIQTSYLKFEAACDFEHCVIIQEMLHGQEYGLDIINDLTGSYQNTIVKEKYAMRSGETDCAKTVDMPILKQLGHKLSQLLHHIGNLDCDVFMVGDTPYVLEMNARFGGGYPFSHAAGVDLPSAIVKWLTGETPDFHLLDAKTGVLAHKDIAIKILEGSDHEKN